MLGSSQQEGSTRGVEALTEDTHDIFTFTNRANGGVFATLKLALLIPPDANRFGMHGIGYLHERIQWFGRDSFCEKAQNVGGKVMREIR